MAEPKAAPAMPTAMNVKNTRKANASFDPHSFSFDSFAETAAVDGGHSGVVSTVVREGVREGGGWNPSGVRI